MYIVEYILIGIGWILGGKIKIPALALDVFMSSLVGESSILLEDMIKLTNKIKNS